jgi:hypothetical protein
MFEGKMEGEARDLKSLAVAQGDSTMPGLR